MRVEFKAKVAEVKEVIEGEKGKRQHVLLQVPIYDTFSGDQIKVQNFPATILGQNIDKIQAQSLLGEIVKCVCFLGSFENQKENTTYWNLSLSCIEMNVIESK